MTNDALTMQSRSGYSSADGKRRRTAALQDAAAQSARFWSAALWRRFQWAAALVAIFWVSVQTSFAKSLLFKNAIVHTIAKGDIQNGQVLVTDGKISAVASADAGLHADETVDLKGAHLYPGFIN